MSSETVHVLLNKDRRISSICARREDADAKCERYNADPFISAGERDADAPYSVETWAVQK